MESLSSSDTQNLHQGIQKLYTLQNLNTFGVDALTILNQLIPSEMPVFYSMNVQARQISSIFLQDFPNFTPETERVMHQYLDEHPIASNMPQTLNGAYKISDFISQKELHCLEVYYQQFLRPLDLADQMNIFLSNGSSSSWSKLLKTDTILSGFTLQRSQRNFTERDRLILNLLPIATLNTLTNYSNIWLNSSRLSIS